MKITAVFKFSACLWFLIALSSTGVQAAKPKQTVGAVEVIQIVEVNLDFKARVDTGAETTSIHAENIKVDGSGDAQGKPISFNLVNKDGRSGRVETRVAAVVKVRSADHSERRYLVPLTLKWNGSVKKILVNLNDRKKMTYGLLLGRNWLRGDYIVDVEKNSDD